MPPILPPRSLHHRDTEIGALHAVLCVRLARNHPLPDGNKRVAYLAMIEFLARNRVKWLPPSPNETAATIEGVSAGTITERELAN